MTTKTPQTDAFNSAEDVQAVIDRMSVYFRTGSTRSTEFRINALRKLRSYLKEHETEALKALNKDLGKTEFEGYATELGIVYDELHLCLKKVRKWNKPKRVPTPITHFRSSSKVYPSPLGVAAILSPWNYPLQLALVPMVDAIAAGNCVALKPSRTSTHTSHFLQKLCKDVFDSRFVYCFPGSGQMNDWLLQVRFDKLFFTGSPRVGHQIMHAAANNLTRVTLELGGKSPCFIDKSANLKRAGQRIAWGKCINSGQTCVAPDYFLVHEDVVDGFIKEFKNALHDYYGDDMVHNDEYAHMINEHHFDRVCGLIDNHNDQAKIVFGGRRDKETLRIEPTVITGVTLDDPVMGEEIFGPVLPIITWKTLDEAIAFTDNFAHPLACYVFAEDKAVQDRVIQEVPFGGATINDVIIHLANNNMGFGGFGDSGLGAYHGKIGFDCFTHYKSTLKKGTWLELPVRVPPFKDKIKILRLLMR